MIPRDHREARPFHAGEEDRGAAGGIDAPMDLRGLLIRVDLGFDSDELPRSFQVGDAFAQVEMAHVHEPYVGLASSLSYFKVGRHSVERPGWAGFGASNGGLAIIEP